jgi:hypothetical protein
MTVRPSTSRRRDTAKGFIRAGHDGAYWRSPGRFVTYNRDEAHQYTFGEFREFQRDLGAMVVFERIWP